MFCGEGRDNFKHFIRECRVFKIWFDCLGNKEEEIMKRLWKDELDEVKEKVLRHFWEEKEKVKKRERSGR